MSSNDQTPPHPPSCGCTPCRYISSLGAGFPSSSSGRRVTGGSNPPQTTPPRLQSQPTQAQVNQANADLQTWANDRPLPSSWRPWDDHQRLRELFEQGPTPIQHPYPTELDMDDMTAPLPPQQQPNQSIYAPDTTTSQMPNQLRPSVGGSVPTPPNTSAEARHRRTQIQTVRSSQIHQNSQNRGVTRGSYRSTNTRHRHSITRRPNQQIQQPPARTPRPHRSRSPRSLSSDSICGEESENTP